MSINLDRNTPNELESAMAGGYVVPRVNLLPDEVLERRQVRRTQYGVGAAAVACVALAAGGFFLAQSEAHKAEADLASEQAMTTSLQAEQAKYSAVPQILAQVKTAEDARGAAMQQDVSMAQMLGNVAAKFPENLWFKQLTITIDPAAPAGTVVAPSLTPVVGKVAITGAAMTHVNVADWLTQSNKIANLSDASLETSSLTLTGGQVVTQYQVNANIGVSAYTHRYDGAQ